jgi:hypothetical protein
MPFSSWVFIINYRETYQLAIIIENIFLSNNFDGFGVECLRKIE